jgi:hypothetical protein
MTTIIAAAAIIVPILADPLASVPREGKAPTTAPRR